MRNLQPLSEPVTVVLKTITFKDACGVVGS